MKSQQENIREFSRTHEIHENFFCEQFPLYSIYSKVNQTQRCLQINPKSYHQIAIKFQFLPDFQLTNQLSDWWH